MSDPITVEDYEAYSEEFFAKYEFVFKRMSNVQLPKAEDVLKVMESLGKVVMDKRSESNSVGPFGFNKKGEEE